jgi:hypothetical protein
MDVDAADAIAETAMSPIGRLLQKSVEAGHEP